MPQQASLINVILLAAGGFYVCMYGFTAKYLGTVMPVTQAIGVDFFSPSFFIIFF